MSTSRDAYPAPEVTVLTDAAEVAQRVAHDLLPLLAGIQATKGTASIVITGGGTGTGSLAAIKDHPQLSSVDWSRVEIWWSDERHVAPDDPERNELQAREALLDHLDLDPALIHPAPWAPDMPAEVAAAALARELEQRADPDVVLLGLGPDVHVGSLFPGFGIRIDDPERAIAVHDSPKPPPVRISLTLPSYRRAQQVWIITAGADKAAAVRHALTATDVDAAPASGARGKTCTRLILDHAAAAEIHDLIHQPEGTRT